MNDRNENPIERTGSDAVKVALEKLKHSGATSGLPVEKSSFSSNAEEEASLILNEASTNEPSRLTNPATEYELESCDTMKKETPTSNFVTMMHVLKGNIGTGILAMPSAISNAGLWIGTLGIPILGLFCVHCMHLLVNSSKTLAKRVGLGSLDYATAAETAFSTGPERFQHLSKVARIAVNSMLMLTQFGFCCVYFLFVGKSINEVVHGVSGSYLVDFRVYMTALLPVMIAFNFIKTLEKLSPFSYIANVLQISGLCMVFYFLAQNLPPVTSVPGVAPIEKWPLFFGSAMYAFEGIGVILPLENAMATPEDFRGFTGVLNTAMVIVACLYTGVGFYGYLKYGDQVKGSITFNLKSPVAGEVVRIMFAVAIFLSYPLQMYVPVQILWPRLQQRFKLDKLTPKKQMVLQLVFRASLVFLTFVLAISIPMLNLFISLVGALASSSLALIFPPIIELMTRWNSTRSRKKLYVILVKNVFIVTLGVVGCILGTYTSIKEIIRCMTEKCEGSD